VLVFAVLNVRRATRLAGTPTSGAAAPDASASDASPSDLLPRDLGEAAAESSLPGAVP
jgi:hypothetical protein